METLQQPNQDRDTVQLLERLLAPRPTVIGIEGGPCGGKTTLVKRVMAAAGDRPVICVPEAASQHILALAEQGIDFSALEYGNRSLYIETEAKILKSIVHNIDQAVVDNTATNAIILADRCDIAAYVEPDEYQALLQTAGLTDSPINSRVDQLYYLPSVARIDHAKYEALKTTNAARFETAERAAEICLRNQAAVADHPELHIGWGKDFEDTIDHLSQSILHPEQESEVKFIASDAQVQALLARAEQLSTHTITQSYHTLAGRLFRLRKTLTESGSTIYHLTVKTGDGIARHEVQRRIDVSTYKQLYMAEMVGVPLMKQRQHVLAEQANDKMRAWSIDRYYDRRLPEWNIETDVVNVTEAARLLEQMQGFEHASYGAETLARQLGAYALQ